jgi:thiosulfate/3-mercaptopyruvate sulfurtransferase
MLLPADMIAAHLSLLGISPDDLVVIVAGEKLRDATLVGIALDRVGHSRWGILEGGFDAWAESQRPLENAISTVNQVAYSPRQISRSFAVDWRQVASRAEDERTVIIDTRPSEYYVGDKSDEARPGHIPGAVNRPYSEDLNEAGQLASKEQLAAAYASILGAKDTPVIVHCRTGHQASQTYYVLKYLLGYTDVCWYDASWTEWAARLDLPATTEGPLRPQ